MKEYLYDLYKMLIHFQQPEEQWGGYGVTPGRILSSAWNTIGGEQYTEGGHTAKFLRKHCPRAILERKPQDDGNFYVAYATPCSEVYTIDRVMLAQALTAVRVALRDGALEQLQTLRARADYEPNAADVKAAPASCGVPDEEVISRVLALNWTDVGTKSKTSVDVELARRCAALHKELAS